jgi:regulation of enolase protein 1 (concanavalin A-like superfamily)
MSAPTTTRPASYTSTAAPGSDGFPQLLRAEWTKLRTVRSWVAGVVLSGLAIFLLGMLSAAGSQVTCGGGSEPSSGDKGAAADCGPRMPPIGPGGQGVNDNFLFVHQPLAGDGTITARVASLTGAWPDGLEVEPWAKAGLMIKDGTAQGATYAAVMATGGHGVRWQHDFVHDTAGSSATVSESDPRWLRLTRSGDTVTGFESPDGSRWSEVGSTELDGLPDNAQVGLFVASPEHAEFDQGFGTASSAGGPTLATATFRGVTLGDGWGGDAWRDSVVGEQLGDLGGPGGPVPGPEAPPAETSQRTGDAFVLSGSGDVAPVTGGPTGGLERSLLGIFAGLIAAVVVGVLFVTVEYRRGMMRTTLTASPRRGRVLVAKALVLGTATFVVGLLASLLSVWLVSDLRRDHGEVILPLPAATEVRIVIGTAALLASASVLGLAIGALLRRSGGAVAAGIVALVLPYLLVASFAVPPGAGDWLLRVTPAAGFAVQQGIPEYEQVNGDYLPALGYYPMPWWAGFGVTVLWACGLLAVAVVRLGRRDA